MQSEHTQENIRRDIVLTACMRHSLWYRHGFRTFSSGAWAEKETDGNPHRTGFSSSFSSYRTSVIFLIPVAGARNASATVSVVSSPLRFTGTAAQSALASLAWGQLSSQCSVGQASYFTLVRSYSSQEQLQLSFKAGLVLVLLDNDS